MHGLIVMNFIEGVCGDYPPQDTSWGSTPETLDEHLRVREWVWVYKQHDQLCWEFQKDQQIAELAFLSFQI